MSKSGYSRNIQFFNFNTLSATFVICSNSLTTCHSELCKLYYCISRMRSAVVIHSLHVSQELCKLYYCNEPYLCSAVAIHSMHASLELCKLY
uniref:Uncharacterized protein n=1 Tax=Arundo donax TaxID=35708 RepID=A0A0A9FN28_ARUDO